VAVDEPIGACTGCGILACSLHAARYARYQCAICVPALAVLSAVTGTPSPAGAAALSVVPPDRRYQLDEAALVLDRIVNDLAASDRQEPSVTYASPNVVFALDVAIAEIVGRDDRDQIAAPDTPRQEIIAAAVRMQMSRMEPNPTPSGAAMLAGALAIGYELATGIKMFADHYTISDLPAPWAAARPILLDPLVWMVMAAARLR
jgi:hypothetical protein